MLLRGVLRSYVCATLVFLVCACSALRIDVDVYKGPLSNEPTVQDKELPILLTGAKPVLLRLRNSLDASITGKEETRYISQYPFDKPFDKDRPGADSNVAARAVNDVLFLYEDEAPAPLQPYVNEVSEHVPDYAAAARDLSGLSDPTLWPQWQAAMRIPPTDKYRLDCQTAFAEYFDRDYAYSHTRTANQINPMCGAAVASATNLSDLERQNAAFPSDYSSNATYARLEDPSFVAVYAKLLFGNIDSSEARAFIAAVTKKARAFRAAREHLRAVWLAALDAFPRLDTPDSIRAKPGMATLIARVTEVRYLAGEFCREQSNHETESPLLAVLTQDAAGQDIWNTANYSTSRFRRAREALEHALLSSPSEVTLQLREADARFRSAETVPESCRYYDPEAQNGVTKPYLDSPQRRIYGLLDGPLVTDKELTIGTDYSAQSISPAQLKSLTRNTVPESADGFESGRLPQGITTIVRNYLQSLNNGDLDVDSDDARAQRVRLRTAAVQFAEKLLILTNSDRLFQPPKGDVNVMGPQNSSWQTEVPLLQAIANGILVQAQELEAYQTYLDSGQHQAPADRLLANAAQQDGAVRYLGQLLSSLQPSAATDAKGSAGGTRQPSDSTAQKPENPAAAQPPAKSDKKAKTTGEVKKAAPAKPGETPTSGTEEASSPAPTAEEPPAGAATQAKADFDKAQEADDEANAKYKALLAQEAGATAALDLVIAPGGPAYVYVLQADARTPAAAAVAIGKWIDASIKAAIQGKVDPKLTQAKSFFASTKFPNTPEADSPRQVYNAMAVRLRQLAIEAKEAEPAAKQAKTVADAALTKAKQALAAAAPAAPATGTVAQATADLNKAQNADDEANAKYKALLAQEAGATAALDLLIEPGGPAFESVLQADAKTPAAVAAAVGKWIDASIKAAPQGKVDPKLTQAKGYFASTKFPKTPAADSPRQAYVDMAACLSKAVTAAKNAEPAAKQAKTLADAALTKAKQTLAAVNGAQPGGKQTPPAKDCSPSATTLADAAEAIEDALPSILDQLRTTNLLSSATSAYFGLVQAMTTGCEAGTKDAAVTAVQYRAGLAFLMAHPLVADLDTPVPATWPGSKTSSIDSVIASLRYEEIDALAVGDDARQKSIAAALQAAYDYRASLTYIRPASAYLRSAYPATVFQTDNGVAWKNLLEEEGRRGSPFFSESLANKTGFWNPNHAETILRIEAADENDKQSWQNINSVKVSGSAFTNYVVTKDDIGNWYIKSFSSDPSTVIDAATKLAQFNLGVTTSAVNAAKTAATQTPAKNADTANVLDKAGTADAKSAQNSSSKTPSTGVQRIIDKYQATYKTTTTNDFDRALKLDAELKSAISDAWSANTSLSADASLLKIFQKNLASATGSLKDQLALLQLPKDKTKAAEVDLGAQIVLALENVRRCYISIEQMIADDKASTELTKTATDLAERATRELLVDFVASREATVRTFSTAVTVAGEGAD